MLRKVISTKLNVREDFKYPLFLTALAAFLFLPSLVRASISEILSDILFVVLIISTLFLISAESKIIRAYTMAIGILGISAEIVDNFFWPLGDNFQTIFLLLFFIYFITLFSELIGQIFRSKLITLNVVLGAFTGYIMIGIIGYFVFRIIFLLNPESFALPDNSSRDLFYFAFITLTTIGYGDISPVTEAARNFAIIVGLVGQFYNTVIIAIIIGKFLQR
ncbi:MAG: potassium channel family protein [Cyclobacteriaceae bacterium]|jgi:hypothetical protein